MAKRKIVPAEEFLTAQWESNTAKELAKRLGQSDATVKTRMAQFKKHNVPIKKYEERKYAWDQLIKLGKELSEKNNK